MRSNILRAFLTRVFLAYLVMSPPAPLPAQSDEIGWFDDYQEALDEARKTNKPLFLEFRCEP